MRAINKQEFGIVRQALRDWYGSRRAAVEMTTYCPKPSSIELVANKVLQQVVTPEIATAANLRDGWKEIVGKQIAAISMPLSIKEKVLTLEVKHSAWMRELNGPIKATLIIKINRFIGKKVCNELRFVPAGRSFH